MNDIKNVIEAAFERRAEITPRNVDTHVKEAVDEAIHLLDTGKLRVADRHGVGKWTVNEWLKKAVLLSFRINDNEFMKGGFTNYFDKVPSKYADCNSRDFREGGVRVVPPATARRGSYIAPGVVLMPSCVIIGGNVELVKENVNRMLVNGGDAVSMAQALLGYLRTPARIAEHGEQARQHAEQRFSIPAMAEAYATVYDQTLGRVR